MCSVCHEPRRERGEHVEVGAVIKCDKIKHACVEQNDPPEHPVPTVKHGVAVSCCGTGKLLREQGGNGRK